MNPKASRAARVLRRSDSQAVFHRPNDDSPVMVDAFAARVWDLADGTRPAAAIARVLADGGIPGATLPRVWSALDRLSDLGLLERRVSPPAGAAPTMPRRAAIRHGMAIAAGAASLAITGVLAAESARAQTANPMRKQAAEQQAKHEQSLEQDAKQGAEQQQKRAAEQHSKQNAEQHAKQGAEQQHKRAAELQNKRNAEQHQKQSAEQRIKRAAEQRSKAK